MSLKLLILADSHVGFECVQWLVSNYPSDIGAIFTTKHNDISELAKTYNIYTDVFLDQESFMSLVKTSGQTYDLGLLLWWPWILKEPTLSTPVHGFVNTHPSYLPFNRGKSPNFWSLVEQCPFGVSLHKVEPGIDTGDIIAQKRIEYVWEDTGGSLYSKALSEMIHLFKESYPGLRTLEFPTSPQDLSCGSFHYGSELESASLIHLDSPTTPRHLLNLLRARTFEGYPACHFVENRVKYEVRVTIDRLD